MAEPLTPAAIRGLRARLGLTQAEFADRLGCSTQAISFWERGTRSPTGLYARAVRRMLAEADASTPITPPPPSPGARPPRR